MFWLHAQPRASRALLALVDEIRSMVHFHFAALPKTKSFLGTNSSLRLLAVVRSKVKSGRFTTNPRVPLLGFSANGESLPLAYHNYQSSVSVNIHQHCRNHDITAVLRWLSFGSVQLCFASPARYMLSNTQRETSYTTYMFTWAQRMRADRKETVNGNLRISGRVGSAIKAGSDKPVFEIQSVAR